MAWLRDLFETNQIIVLSIYGQVFFVMGLAIALQSRHRSELALARALPWLAAFGIAHGLGVWGYLFIPIQSDFLPAGLIEVLLWVQLGLRGLAFALLLQFGAELLLATRANTAAAPSSPLGIPWLRLVAPIAAGLWVVGTLVIGAAAGDVAVDPTTWLPMGHIAPAVARVGAPLAVGDLLARGMLALPGALAVVIGLRRSAAALEPIALPPVGGALRFTAVAFAAFILVEGLVPLPSPFPLASIVNGRTVLETIGIPIEVLRSLVGLAMAIGVVRSLELFEQETDRRLAEALRGELLAEERDRIGRDLHDGIIQSIYAAGLQLEAVADRAGDEMPASASEDLRAGTRVVMGELNRITGEIRRTIFDLRSASLDARDPERLVAAVADELRAHGLLEISLRVVGAWRVELTDDQAEQLRHIVREALSNVLRHAGARRVGLTLELAADALALEVRDDGIGFDVAAVEATHDETMQGLRNLRRRTELLGARLVVRSAPGRGTRLSLTMPVVASRREA
ncbi:MAG: ATP-binding protein [Chloroflexota bacterium]